MVLGSLFRRAPSGGRTLVAFASQTGAAERIAWLSANALGGAARNLVRVAALGGLTAQDLADAGILLVVTSTYGAGEAPDSARAFVRKQMASVPVLKGVNFAVLALGDRKYDATFCGFGRGLDRWLASARAKRMFDIICVDGDDDTDAMTKWCEQLNKLGADTKVEQLMPGAPQDWTLAERRLLNPGSPGGEAWHIALTPKDAAQLDWTAGDGTRQQHGVASCVVCTVVAVATGTWHMLHSNLRGGQIQHQGQIRSQVVNALAVGPDFNARELSAGVGRTARQRARWADGGMRQKWPSVRRLERLSASGLF